MSSNIVKIPLDALVLHEEFNEEHAREVLEWLKRDGYQLRPIAVFNLKDFDSPKKFLVLDGHHRTEALRRLGYKFIMANTIDYFSSKFRVLSWQNGKEYDKLEVIKVVREGKKLRPKTTKHAVEVAGNLLPFQDNDLVEPEIFTSLEELR